MSLWNETLLSPRIISKRSQLHVNLPERLPTSALSARLNQTSTETSQPVSRKFHLKQVVGASYPARERGCVSRYVKHLEISFKKRILTLDNIESWWEPRRRPVLARGQQLLTSCFLLTSLYFYGDHNSSLIFNSSCWTGSIAGSAQNRLCDNNKTETMSGPRRPEGFLGFV